MVTASTIYILHVGAFALAAAACFLSLARVLAIDDPATRRGLAGLLGFSGLWAAAHVAYLLASSPALQVAAYVTGLIVGFATVFAWLYFCSAFTGRIFHRRRPYVLGSVGIFLGATALKLTNPIHGWYFSTTQVTQPFPHLAIEVGPLHWVLMGLSYALAFVGYFLLVELFEEVEDDTGPLFLLLLVTALPVTLDIISPHVPQLLDLTYEPLGVAVFGVGVTYVYFGQFRSIRLAAERDKPTIAVDPDGNIRELNSQARALFSEEAVEPGTSLETAFPEIQAVLDQGLEGERVVECSEGDETRYYRVTSEPIGAPKMGLGSYLVLEDVTSREQYRRELERQNDRLESFATIVSHDLRNPLTVAMGRLEMAMQDQSVDDEDLEAVEHALERMERLIEDVLAIAREGRPVEETEPVVLSSIAEQCWQMVETDNVELVVDEEFRFRADPDRLQRLFENLFRNAIEHGRVDEEPLTVRVGPTTAGDGFYVADDGRGIDPETTEEIFEPGFTTREGGTGFGLSIVSEIADAHGWTVEIAESDAGGARFEFRDVETGSG